jgi:hypothetical protein
MRIAFICLQSAGQAVRNAGQVKKLIKDRMRISGSWISANNGPDQDLKRVAAKQLEADRRVKAR